MKSDKVMTKGNINVKEIEVGDIHYEFAYGSYIECEVVIKPVRTEVDGDVVWTWKSRNTLTGEYVDYLVNEKYSHYSANLYNFMAYMGCTQV